MQEDANGQFEVNWDPADALVTADRHCFFKYMAAALAEKHGVRKLNSAVCSTTLTVLRTTAAGHFYA